MLLFTRLPICLLACSLPSAFALFGIDTEYWFQAAQDIIESGVAEEAWSWVNEIYQQFSNELPEELRAYEAALADDWNSNIKTSPSYVWASKFGTLTQVMRVDLEWEELNTKRPKRYDKKQHTLYYTLTPKFVHSTSVQYVDRVRLLKKSADIKAAQDFVVAAKGFNMGDATAFSPTGQRDGEIIAISKSDYFHSDVGSTDDPQKYTSLAWLVIYELVTNHRTDFDIMVGVGGWRSKVDSVPGSGSRWINHNKKRNLHATARVTGEHTYLYRRWLVVPLIGGKAWWGWVPSPLRF